MHENCADAILELNADDSLEVPAVVAVLYHSLAKWADDLIQWSTTEYGFVDIPDRYCNTSSIMMQKKNVIGPAEVKGASAEALGCFVTSYHALKGTTGLPITERYYALEMLWKVADSAVRDLGWFCDLLPVLEIHKEHMREQAWRHWATATDLAGALVSERGSAVAHRASDRRHPGEALRRARARAGRRHARSCSTKRPSPITTSRQVSIRKRYARRSTRKDSSPCARCAAAPRKRSRCGRRSSSKRQPRRTRKSSPESTSGSPTRRASSKRR